MNLRHLYLKPETYRFMDRVQADSSRVPREVVFAYDPRVDGKRLQPLIGHAGWLQLGWFKNALAGEGHGPCNYICGVRDDGHDLGAQVCTELVAVKASDVRLEEVALPPEATAMLHKSAEKAVTEIYSACFNAESSKVDAWAEQLISGLEEELATLKRKIADTKREAALQADPNERLDLRAWVANVERRLENKRAELLYDLDRIQARNAELLSQFESCVDTVEKPLLTVRWKVEVCEWLRQK